jgi:hypothetical protein
MQEGEFSVEISELPEMKIYLNIYDLHPVNKILSPIGLGAYHTGVQFFDTEFAFGAHEGSHTGVFESVPKKSTQGMFRESIYIGVCELGIEKIFEVLEELKLEYVGCTYDLLNKNCNHFSEDLVRKLTTQRMPSYINRLAKVMKCCRCFLSKEFLAAHNPKVNPKHRKADSIFITNKRKKKKKNTQIEEKASLTNRTNDSSSHAI